MDRHWNHRLNRMIAVAGMAIFIPWATAVADVSTINVPPAPSPTPTSQRTVRLYSVEVVDISGDPVPNVALYYQFTDSSKGYDETLATGLLSPYAVASGTLTDVTITLPDQPGDLIIRAKTLTGQTRGYAWIDLSTGNLTIFDPIEIEWTDPGWSVPPGTVF